MNKKLTTHDVCSLDGNILGNCNTEACQDYLVNEIHYLPEDKFWEILANIHGDIKKPHVVKTRNQIRTMCQECCDANRVIFTNNGKDDVTVFTGVNRDPNNYATMSIAFFMGILRLYPDFTEMYFYKAVDNAGVILGLLYCAIDSNNKIVYCGDITEAYPIQWF